MTRRLGIFLILALLLGLTLGCGMCGLVGRETEETPSPVVEEIEEAEEIEEVEEIGEIEAEEDISLSSLTSGLQSLDSYRSHLRMAFESGEDSSEDEQWTVEMDIEYVRDPFAQRIVVQGGGMGIIGEDGLESVQIGDQQYAVFGDQCVSSSISGGETMDMEIFEPDDVMGGLEHARRVRPDETVNGVLCRHYVFDETAITWTALTHAEGEVWIAVDGDYVVKYTMEAEGLNPASREEGHVEWEYQVRDVNVPITIEPPAGCRAAESEFPIMPDATNTSTFGGVVSYESNSSFDDVLAFYQEQMPAEGWSETGDSFITTGTAMLSYTKDGRTATITLTGADVAVSVIIMSE